MNKLIRAALIGLCLGAAAPVWAQERQEAQGGGTYKNEASTYCLSVAIDRIYSYKSGYVITYRTGIRKKHEAYIPFAWFSERPRKGELVTFGTGKVQPTLTVYYQDGKFLRCRIYAREDVRDSTWGTIPSGTNLDDKFEGAESLTLEF